MSAEEKPTPDARSTALAGDTASATPPNVPPVGSDLPTPPWVPAARDPAQIMLVLDDRLAVDLHPEPAWLGAPVELEADGRRLLASAPVRTRSVPRRLRALIGGPIEVHAANGRTCRTTISALRVDAVAFDVEGADDLEDARVAAALRKTALEALAGVGVVFGEREDEPTCTGVWARRADLPAPVVFGRADLAGADAAALRDDVLAALASLPEFIALAGEYAALREAEPDAPTFEKFVARGLQVARWDEVGGTRRVVTVTLRDPAWGCGERFSGALALLLSQETGGIVRLPQPGWFGVQALMDLDADGVLEAVTHDFPDTWRIEADGARSDAYRDEWRPVGPDGPC